MRVLLSECLRADGSGEVNFEEFRGAVRDRMKIPTRLTLLAQNSLGAAGARVFNKKKGFSIEDDELEELFTDADTDSGGSVSSQEFAEYLVSVPRKAKGKKESRKQKRQRDLKLLIQEACREEVDRIGWQHLFSGFDENGSGELDVGEFTTVMREHARVSAKVVSDENISALFQAIDRSGDGLVDAEELLNFLLERPFEAFMRYEPFVDSMFQLAHSWVEDDEKAWLFEACNSVEEKYLLRTALLYIYQSSFCAHLKSVRIPVRLSLKIRKVYINVDRPGMLRFCRSCSTASRHQVESSSQWRCGLLVLTRSTNS